MRMAPHKSCCGCCCNLEIGAPVGVVLLLLLYILQAVLSSIAASAMSASYQLDAAKAFCFKTTKGYRDGYAYCYKDNVCTGHDDMDSLYSKSTAANTMFIIGSWLSVLALVYTLTATLKRTEQGPLAVHHSWKLLLFFPCWHFLAAIVNAALAAEEVQFMTAVEFYERAAADRHCNQVPLGTSDLPFIEGFKTGDVDCAEYKDVGVPDRSDQEGRGWMGSVCEPEGKVAMFIVWGFAWTIVVHVVLVGIVTFNVYSLACQIKDADQGQGGTQMGASTTAHGQPAVAVATAVAVPATAVAVATAVVVATPVAA